MKDVVEQDVRGLYQVIGEVHDARLSEDAARWPIPFEWDDVNQPVGTGWWETPGDGASTLRLPGMSGIVLGQEAVS